MLVWLGQSEKAVRWEGHMTRNQASRPKQSYAGPIGQLLRFPYVFRKNAPCGVCHSALAIRTRTSIEGPCEMSAGTRNAPPLAFRTTSSLGCTRPTTRHLAAASRDRWPRLASEHLHARTLIRRLRPVGLRRFADSPRQGRKRVLLET